MKEIYVIYAFDKGPITSKRHKKIIKPIPKTNKNFKKYTYISQDKKK